MFHILIIFIKIYQNTLPVGEALYSLTEVIALLFAVIVPIFVIKVLKKIRLDFLDGLGIRYHL